jgi:hypothetical protein
MWNPRLLTILRQRINTIPKRKQALIDINPFSFPHSILIIQFFWPSQIDNKQLRIYLLFIFNDLHINP